MKLTPELMLTRAIMRGLMRDPFYATLLLDLELVPVKGMGTCGTDGVKLTYDPAWVETRRDDMPVICVHEAIHIALGHQFRRKTLERVVKTDALLKGDKRGLDTDAWQRACDCEVNSLIRGRVDFQSDALTATKLGLPEGELAEWYYAKLAGAPDGDNPGGGTGKGRGGLGNVMPHPQMGEGGEGSGEEAEASAKREWEQKVTQAALAAKKAGKLPGWMEERLDAMLEPARVNWKTALRQFASETIRSGTSWRRPSRRLQHLPAFMPSRRMRTVGNVLFAVDTSGSMGADECNLALGELAGIMGCYPRARLTMVQCDTRIVDRKEFASGDAMEVKELAKSGSWKGRGGTCMQPVIDLANKERPQCLILLTDGEMSWPTRSNVPVLWVLTTARRPPWGKTTRLR